MFSSQLYIWLFVNSKNWSIQGMGLRKRKGSADSRQASCCVYVGMRLPNSCWGMGQWCGSHFSFSRAGTLRQYISRLALESFQDSLALTSSARNRERFWKPHPCQKAITVPPWLCNVALFLSTALPCARHISHLLATAQEASVCLLTHNQKWLRSKQQLG